MPKNGAIKNEITETDLKIIAVITMLIDHIGVGLLFNSDVYMLLRIIGRMAFPIYCFMLVEGFIHTRDIKKYALRLLIIAIVSEIPFDLMLTDKPIFIQANNVLWELLLALVVLYGYSLVDMSNKNIYVRIIAKLFILALGMTAAHFTFLDYSEAGICCISVMYFLRGETKVRRLFSFAAGVLILTLMSNTMEAYAFLMLIPLYFYNGTRGADSKALRWFFYLFYPIHISIIVIIYFAFSNSWS